MFNHDHDHDHDHNNHSRTKRKCQGEEFQMRRLLDSRLLWVCRYGKDADR